MTQRELTVWQVNLPEAWSGYTERAVADVGHMFSYDTEGTHFFGRLMQLSCLKLGVGTLNALLRMWVATYVSYDPEGIHCLAGRCSHRSSSLEWVC